jgi:predicted metal-dependent HD superfamily phosphohydrolase
MNPFSFYYNILKTYIRESFINSLYNLWDDPKRKYHNIDHLKNVLAYIEKNRNSITSYDRYISLILAAFFHDAWYDPKNNFNEDKSIDLLFRNYTHLNKAILHEAIKLIETTKHRVIPSEKLSKLFWMADNEGFTKDFEHHKLIEQKIRSEFSHIGDKQYCEKRIEFLKTNIDLFDKKINENILKLIKYCEDIYKK